MRSKRYRCSVLSGGITALVITVLSVAGSAPAIPDADEDGEECTTVIAVGTATVDGKTRTGQNHDGTPWTGQKPSRVVRITVNEKTGIKTINELNSCGVARQGNGRNPFPGMEGGASTFADPKEAYVVEYAFAKKDHPHAKDPHEAALASARTAKEAVDVCVKELPAGSYHIIGPLRNQAFGQANAYLTPALLALQSDPAFSRDRQKRVQDLLRADDPRHGPTVSGASGQISTLYLFSVLRNHEVPWGFDTTWKFGRQDLGDLCRWSYRGISRNGDVREISSDYPDLLSIYWTTAHFPAFSPFLPFYIGLTSIPPTFADGKTNESDIFRELFHAIAYKMNYADDVQRFWESFDLLTVSELELFETDVKGFMDRGDRKGAEKLLYNFSNRKCELAVSYAKELVKIIVEGRPITDVRVNTSLPKRPTWEWASSEW